MRDPEDGTEMIPEPENTKMRKTYLAVGIMLMTIVTGLIVLLLIPTSQTTAPVPPQFSRATPTAEQNPPSIQESEGQEDVAEAVPENYGERVEQLGFCDKACMGMKYKFNSMSERNQKVCQCCAVVGGCAACAAGSTLAIAGCGCKECVDVSACLCCAEGCSAQDVTVGTNTLRGCNPCGSVIVPDAGVKETIGCLEGSCCGGAIQGVGSGAVKEVGGPCTQTIITTAGETEQVFSCCACHSNTACCGNGCCKPDGCGDGISMCEGCLIGSGIGACCCCTCLATGG